MSEWKSGDTFGRWMLESKIGEGGNGEVWRATERDTGRKGAIKFLFAKFQKGDHVRFKRFRDEIKTQNSLADNEGVLPVLDSHVPENPGAQNPAWLVTTLAEKLKDVLVQYPQSIESIVGGVVSFAETLAALHARGISHRDIKPSNLYRLDGRWVIGDFGLVDYPDKEQVTAPTEKLGPQHFIAPEMMHQGGLADGDKADVYSLAKTLWVLLTDQTYPPPGELRHDSAALTVGAYVRHPKIGRLDRLIERATKHDPAARLSMLEFASELRYWINPPEIRISEGEIDWAAAGERLRRDKEKYEEECRARTPSVDEDRQISEDVRVRMERLMTEWSQKLGVGLSGGGLTQPVLPMPPEAQTVANASVHLTSPRPEVGRLTGWVGVHREGAEQLHILAAVGIFWNAQSNLLWSHRATALAGSAHYDHQIDSIVGQLKEQFEHHIPRFLERL